jgi:hypothetical protein
MKAGHCPKQKKMIWGQYGNVMPFARVGMYVIRRPSWEQKKKQYACTLLGTSSRNEGAM